MTWKRLKELGLDILTEILEYYYILVLGWIVGSFIAAIIIKCK